MRLTWRRYRLPLRSPPTTGGAAVREGLLVRLEDGRGSHGWGEVAPLPGLHRESLAEAETALRALRDAAARREVDDVRAWAAQAPPSVAFGVETAAERAREQARGQPPPRGLLEIAALLPRDCGGEAELRALRGRALAKVKVGSRPVAEDAARLQRLLAAAPELSLRLDGNGALPLEDACALVDALPPARVQLFEEPLRDPGRLPLLHERTGVRLALDESLHRPELAGLRTAPGVVAWVLKPALLGRAATRALAEDAVRSGRTPILSSCFESGLGLWALAELAVELGGTAAGLGTDAWLAADTVEPPFSSASGLVDLARAAREPSCDGGTGAGDER